MTAREKWSYKQITEATEQTIQRHHRTLRSLRKTTTDLSDWYQSRMQVSGWAYGAIDLWSTLTEGWADNPHDYKRLQSMMEAIDSEPFDAKEKP